MEEHFFQCPYCWEQISMLFDHSISKQIYIEDCEICCSPLEINIEFKHHKIIKLNIETT